MPDPADPTTPPPAPAAPTPPPASEPEVNASTTDLPSNIAAAIAVFVPLIGGIIFYVLEKRDGFVRFYAKQSIVFGGAWLLFAIIARVIFLIFSSVPLINVFLTLLWGLVVLLVHLAFVVVWVIAMIKAFTNVRWEIPYLGPIARKQFGEEPI